MEPTSQNLAVKQSETTSQNPAETQMEPTSQTPAKKQRETTWQNLDETQMEPTSQNPAKKQREMTWKNLDETPMETIWENLDHWTPMETTWQNLDTQMEPTWQNLDTQMEPTWQNLDTQMEPTWQNLAETQMETAWQNLDETQTETTHGVGGERKSHRASPRRPRVNEPPQPQMEASQFTDNDVAYFNAYAQFGVHETMIKDDARTSAYQAAILHHHNLIKDKVVMDVGCGIGILSIFCAHAGARRVYAVEASGIAEQAKLVVEANNLAGRVTVLHGRVEDIQIDEKVDVIISEWMGYMLLHEGMLGSVIFARDRWLKSGGLILPSHATLYMAPITHPKRYRDSVSFWGNVHGINMSPMMVLAKQSAFENPCVERIWAENVLTLPHMVKRFNCYTVQKEELKSVTTAFMLQSKKQAALNGFAFWFDVEFDGNPTSNDPTLPSPYAPFIFKRNVNGAPVLSTGPEDDSTHWFQTILYFYEPVELKKDQIIEGTLTISQTMQDFRGLHIHLFYIMDGKSFEKEVEMR